FPAIDATGQILATSAHGVSGSFDGATELATQLAGATQTRQCFALQELRYALSRVESRDDACSAQALYAAFSSGKFGLKDLLVAMTGTDAFRYRSTPPAGGSCR